MVNPAPSPTPATVQLVNDLDAVSFRYRNGTTLTFRGDALQAWTTLYRLLLTIHDSLLKTETKPSAPQPPPTTLADELKKRS